jgi:hypothetical protein
MFALSVYSINPIVSYTCHVLFDQKAFIITVLVKVVAAGLRLGSVLLLPVLSVICFPSGVELVSK